MRTPRGSGQKVSEWKGLFGASICTTHPAHAPEALWPVMRIAHTRSRYIYDLYYKREAISKELYDWLLKQGYADAK